jgi:HEAT repeat protein
MTKHLSIALLFAGWAAVAFGQQAPPADGAARVKLLLGALHNEDESIREEAFRLLQQDETLPAMPALVESLRTGEQGAAARAASAIVARLDYLRLNPDPMGPRLVLTDEDRADLQPVREIIDHNGVARWRWYLCEWVIEQLDAPSLARHVPALVEAVYTAQPMRQYAAVRALHVLGKEAGQPAKTALLAALRQWNRPKFVGIYMRYRRTIERNEVAFTDDVWTPIPNSPELTYYADDELLISDTLLEMGATFEELGGTLTILSRHENDSVRLQASRQLVQLGPEGARIADPALAGLLRYRRSSLVRQLADENAPTREGAINLLAGLDGDAQAVIMPLAALLDSSEDRLRQSAAITLGRLGTVARDALPALRRAIQMEQLIANRDAVVTPESLERAQERLADMQAALEAIESAEAEELPAGEK